MDDLKAKRLIAVSLLIVSIMAFLSLYVNKVTSPEDPQVITETENSTDQTQTSNPTDKLNDVSSTNKEEDNNSSCDSQVQDSTSQELQHEDSTGQQEQADPADQIAFQTISKGHLSGHRTSAYYVIKNEDQWTEVWNKHQCIFLPQLPPPEVDFSKSMIIAVFMGEFTTGGYGIEIIKIDSATDSLIVTVEKTYPGKGCAVTLALSQPYHIVKIDKTEKEIAFETVERTIEYP